MTLYRTHNTDIARSCFLEVGVGEATETASTTADVGYQSLAGEAAVAFCYNGVSHAVMMSSPCDLEDFAYGFSLTSGVIQYRAQIIDLEIEVEDESALLHITLNQRALSQLRSSRRVMAGTSGCGLCGVDALSQALAPLESCTSPHFTELPPMDHLRGLRQRFQLAQQYRETSGAMHAAIYIREDGLTRLCREDIGRHNALDKLIGACVRDELDLRAGFVAITSRCSLELIQKCLRAGVGTLVSLASPSDTAVRWARQYKLNLLHQPAEGAPRMYSGAAIARVSSQNLPAG